MALAYLNTEYPSLSHTFIEREIRELRRLGVEIHTFSVRPPTSQGRLGTEHAAAAEETFVLQSGIGILIGEALLSAISSPRRFLRALLKSQRLAPPGINSRLRHSAYVIQGVRLARKMKQENLRHVHVHMANNGAAIAMMACELDKDLSYSLSIHGSAEFFHVDSWTLAPKVEQASFVRCISDFCRAQIMAWTDPSCWERLHIVHCGVDPSVYTPRPLPRTGGPLRLLAVGRLHPIKGYDVLFAACASLTADGLEWELELVGDGPMMPRLRELAVSLKINDRVSFSGAVGQDRIGEYFDRADMIVVSSFMEGVPVVLMEAMARQLAVVATRVGGIPELVREGVDGVMVSPGSADALADALRPFALDPEMCLKLGQSAREQVTDQFAVELLGSQMRQILPCEACPSP